MKTLTPKNIALFWFSFVIVLGCILLVMIWPPLPAEAAPSLPPRYPPTHTQDDGDSDDDRQPVGAYIELHVHSAQAGLWTVVQWQDNTGGWHNVEGWQGAFDEGNKKVWWVAVADFNKGPFRWAAYQGRGGELLAVSEPFYLPHMPNETMPIEVFDPAF